VSGGLKPLDAGEVAGTGQWRRGVIHNPASMALQFALLYYYWRVIGGALLAALSETGGGWLTFGEAAVNVFLHRTRACLLVQDGGLRGFDGRKSQPSPG